MHGGLIATGEGDDRQAWTTATRPASRRLVLVLLAVVLATHARAATAQTYQVTDLGDLGGGTAIAYDINASGQVVGQSRNGGGQLLGFIWLPTAAFGLGPGIYELETLGGTSSEANGINASGQVVGRAFVTGDTAHHAALWPTNGPVVDLGTLGGTNSQAYDINDAGEVVGWSDTTGNQRHAFSWQDTNGNGVSDPGEMVDLGDLGGGQSIAYGINASGQIVGTSSTATFASHAFRTTALGVIDPASDLGTLGGLSSTAYRINDVGQVAGHSQVPGNTTVQAFRTAIVNAPLNPSTDGLGTLGGTRSEAWGLNASGHAVGWSTLSGSTSRRAFFAAAGGVVVDLNTLITPGWTLDAAFGINDGGEIVGSGSGPGGASRAVLLRRQNQLPGAPILTATATGSVIFLSWSPAPGPAVVSYVLEAGTASGLSDLFNGNVGNSTQLSTTVPAGRYFVRVRGVNALGTGAASVEIALSVGIPGTPTVTSAVESAGVLTVAWVAGPGAPAQSHMLHFFSGAALIATLPAGPATTVAIPVPPGVSGTFGVRVTALAGAVASAPSALLPFTLGAACTPPASPSPSGGIAGGTASVSWPPVAGAVSYILSAGTVPGGTQYVAPTSLGANTAVSANGLPTGFTAWVRVVAVNACGQQSMPADVQVR